MKEVTGVFPVEVHLLTRSVNACKIIGQLSVK